MVAAKKWPHPCFSSWAKYVGGEIGATGMIYFEGCRSVAKIIALSRRDNLQVLQVCQMMSITSFEPLSPVVGLKFGLQRKIFSQFYRICILCQDSCFDRRNDLIA